MSSPQVQNTVVAAVAPVKEKKPRKPTLAAKHSKVVIANYSIIQMLHSKGLLSDEGVETAYSEIKLFDSVDDQTAFYESFNTSLKDTGKTMKKFVTQRLKPPKAPRAKKETTAKPRTKKTDKVADDTKVDVVAQLVEAANAPMSPPRQAEAKAPDAPSSVVLSNNNLVCVLAGLSSRLTGHMPLEQIADAPVKAKKPRAKKVAEVVAPQTPEKNEVVAEVKAPDAPVKEKKARKPRAKKEVAPPPPLQLEVKEEVEEEDEEIHTQEIIIGDKTYLIDGENNIYSVETHDHIGTFDPEKNEVVEVFA